METLSIVRTDIHALTEKVKDITVLKIIRNLLELELFEEEEMNLQFPEKLKQLLDTRREKNLAKAVHLSTLAELDTHIQSLKK